MSESNKNIRSGRGTLRLFISSHAITSWPPCGASVKSEIWHPEAPCITLQNITCSCSRPEAPSPAQKSANQLTQGQGGKEMGPQRTGEKPLNILERWWKLHACSDLAGVAPSCADRAKRERRKVVRDYLGANTGTADWGCSGQEHYIIKKTL